LANIGYLPPENWTDRRAGSGAILDPRSLAFGASLLLVLVTLTPFADRAVISTISAGSLDTAYPAFELCLVGISLVLCWSDLRIALPSLVRPFNVFLILWLAVAVVTSENFDLSFRRYFVTLLDMGLATVVLLMPRGLNDFSRVLIFCVVLVLLLCYLGVLLVPSLAIHQANDALEPELAGMWRGLYFHKNTAGTMMVLFVFVGQFAWRTGRRAVGALIATAAVVFLIMTWSKNGLALLVFTLVLTAIAERVRSWRWRAAICLLPLVLLNIFTVGTIFFEPIKHAVDLLGIDSTYTNRSEIWQFVSQRIAERPITGHGLQAFWNTNTAYEESEGSKNWVWRAGGSHNAYFDLALTIGIPGTVLIIASFVIYPLIDYQRQLHEPTNRLLASLFLRIWIFLLYTTALESIFLDRGSTWFMLMMAVFGLRYMSVLRVAR
jgi:O-antigen ligase